MNDQCRESSTGAAAPSRLDDVRALLRSLVTGSKAPRRVPPLLLELASRALPRRQRARDAVDDLVGDLLLHLVEATAAGNARSAQYLLDLDDKPLLAALRQRLRQLAAEGGARWGLCKVIRAHVRAALAGPLPQVEALPLSLMRGEKLCGARVAEAVAFYVQDGYEELRGVPELTTELLSDFFPDHVHPDGERWHQLAADDSGVSVEDHMDTTAVTAHARQLLGHELAEVVSLRSQGLTLEAIGRRCGHATATVFAHLQKAVALLRAGLGEKASLDSVRLALGGLAGDPE